MLNFFAGSETNNFSDVRNGNDFGDLENDFADEDHGISDDLTADIIEEIEDDTEKENLGNDMISQELLNLVKGDDIITNFDGLEDNDGDFEDGNSILILMDIFNSDF